MKFLKSLSATECPMISFKHTLFIPTLSARARAQEQEKQRVRHEREYDTRMSAIDRGRENTGENAMLNAAEQWVKKERR